MEAARWELGPEGRGGCGWVGGQWEATDGQEAARYPAWKER